MEHNEPIFYKFNNISYDIYSDHTLIYVDNSKNVFMINLGYNSYQNQEDISSMIEPVKASVDYFNVDSDLFLNNSFGWFRKRVNLGLLPLEQELENVLEKNTLYPLKNFMEFTKVILDENHLRFNSKKQEHQFYSLGQVINLELLDNMVKGLKLAFSEAIPTTTKEEIKDEEN